MRSVADQVKFLGYALGSVRDCISWYEGSRDRLPNAVVDDREMLIARIRALVLGYIRSLRNDVAPTDARRASRC